MKTKIFKSRLSAIEEAERLAAKWKKPFYIVTINNSYEILREDIFKICSRVKPSIEYIKIGE